MKTLILVESPTKAKTLGRFLGKDYDVEASNGHIRDLPKRKLGVDVDNNFFPQYVVPPDKRKLVENLRNKVREFDTVLLATDPDREGEAIAFHLYEILKKEAENKADFKRIVFHEITKEAVLEALKNPRNINMDLVSAQVARRVLDRIVGYKLSPLLWKRIKSNLSAGRVQSIAMRFVAEREREIEKFESSDYSRVFALLVTGADKEIEFSLVKVNGVSIDTTSKLGLYDGSYQYTKTSLDKEKALKIARDLEGEDFEVTDVITKEIRRSSYPPFVTSSLQQEASRRLYFTSKKTMAVAQKLYEEGFITYHRTDSFTLSSQFIDKARDYIKEEFGEKYLTPAARIFKTKSKLAQEAHEAIRPTQIRSQESKVEQELGRDHAKLYNIIYRRAIATQMSDAIFESTKVIAEIKKDGKTYAFEKNGNVILFDGFLKALYYEDKENILPVIDAGEKLKFKQARILDSKTNPPPRYTEASLIETLEKNGIGRPSTYAPIISTIQDRQYIEKKEGKFYPTPVGLAVNDFLISNFSDIDDIPFTAGMEDKLDDIAKGSISWVPMIRNFYDPFEKRVEVAATGEKVHIPVEETDKLCPKCGARLVIRSGRFGKFFACSRFPECKYKASMLEETGDVCPIDQGKIVVKKTRKGIKFYACANYPACRFAVWNLKQLREEKAN